MNNNTEGMINVNGGAAGGCGETINLNGVIHLGGNGGGGGGVVHICANEIIVGPNARIEAKGGRGGDSSRGGGGGGGGGGLIFIVTRRIIKSDGTQMLDADFERLFNVRPGEGGIGQSSLSSRVSTSIGLPGQSGRVVIIYL
jgi:hypothetical protein